MKKILLILVSCAAILSLAGCTSDADKANSSNQNTTSTSIEGETPLERARREFNRTPDMVYYTYYIGSDIPEEVKNPPTSSEGTPW